MTSIQQFEYEGQAITFEFTDNNVMINATEMAKVFNKRVNDFFINNNTQSFIKKSLSGDYPKYLGIEKEEDFFISKQRTGTWMHRVLALRFAAWLDPAFDLWVCTTIDKVLYGTYHEDVKTLAELKKEKNNTLEKLMNNEDYLKMLEIEAKEKVFRARILKHQTVKVNLFG